MTGYANAEVHASKGFLPLSSVISINIGISPTSSIDINFWCLSFVLEHCANLVKSSLKPWLELCHSVNFALFF